MLTFPGGGGGVFCVRLCVVWTGLNAELCQTAQDMQRALEISRQAREEDLQGLNAELAERDQLLLTAHAENDQLVAEKSRLQAILQVR